MFTTEKAKGKRDYINTQKPYEISRTLIYFAMSATLFLLGYFTTDTKVNLLTIVAVLGCLPACKSAVEMIMYMRYKSCGKKNADIISSVTDSLNSSMLCLYDMIFTSYEKNYSVAHIAVKGNTICGFTEDNNFDEQAFYTHISAILKKDNFCDTSVKIFKDINKYRERLIQMDKMDTDETNTQGIIDTLKSVAL
jgi:hypothetical protein